MNILGIDIGTTTISAVLLNEKNGELIKKTTVKNNSFINSEKHFEKIQNPLIILETVKKTVAELTDGSDISSIGVTGQMHGILYIDKTNTPISPLYIWQDLRGNETYIENKTYSEYLTELTGYKASTGFGLTTHFYNSENNLVPKNAVKITTIHDYLVSVLTNTTPITHASDAHSLGFFDLEKLEFDKNALKKADINPDILPEVFKSTEIVGVTDCDYLKSGIPVSVAIGDNQASFLGSVKNFENSVLVNVGTGSQVSFMTKALNSTASGEIRPLTDDKYLFVGSSLCGGRAYAVLKNFFLLCSDFLDGNDDDIFKRMDILAESADKTENSLKTSCEFAGTRNNPQKRGSIQNISTENFTPANLTYSVLKGVADELYDMYNEAAPLLSFEPEYLVGSGNGLRKSNIWRKIFEKCFSLQITLPKHSEEAAVGACVFSATANKTFVDITASQKTLLGD